MGIDALSVLTSAQAGGTGHRGSDLLSEWAIPELASVPNATEVDCDRLSNSSETEADCDLNSARLLRVRTRRGGILA